jgi:hypothetical protein
MIQEPQPGLVDLRVTVHSMILTHVGTIKADSEIFHVLFFKQFFLYYVGNILTI